MASCGCSTLSMTSGSAPTWEWLPPGQPLACQTSSGACCLLVILSLFSKIRKIVAICSSKLKLSGLYLCRGNTTRYLLILISLGATLMNGYNFKAAYSEIQGRIV